MPRRDGGGAAARRRTRRRVDSVSRDGDGMVLMATRADDIAAPSKFALAAELPRAIWSITSHAFSREMLAAAPKGDGRPVRSDEHTSELQSLMRISYAVFCLKKKKQTKIKRVTKTKTTLTQNTRLTTIKADTRTM